MRYLPPYRPSYRSSALAMLSLALVAGAGLALLFVAACSRQAPQASYQPGLQPGLQQGWTAPAQGFGNVAGASSTTPVNAEAARLQTLETELATRELAVELAEREAALRQREQALRLGTVSHSPQVVSAPAPVYRQARPVAVESEPVYREEARVTRTSYQRSGGLTVPGGTGVTVSLLDSLSTATTPAGTSFRARVTQDVYAGGELAIPAGSEVTGTVAEAVPLRRVAGGRARLTLDFDRVELPSGQDASFPASYFQQGRNETGIDAATIGGSTVAGAILGRQADGRHRDRNTAIGAVVGAGIGTAIANRTRGGEVNLPAGTELTLTLDSPVSLGARI